MHAGLQRAGPQPATPRRFPRCRQRKRLTTGEALTSSVKVLLADEVGARCRSGGMFRGWEGAGCRVEHGRKWRHQVLVSSRLRTQNVPCRPVICVPHVPLPSPPQISTGLDSATTHAMVANLRSVSRNLQVTQLICLLQPPPETVQLFDDVMASTFCTALCPVCWV